MQIELKKINKRKPYNKIKYNEIKKNVYKANKFKNQIKYLAAWTDSSLRFCNFRNLIYIYCILSSVYLLF